MRATKVLLIESVRANGASFASGLQRKYDVQIVHSGKQGLLLAQTKRPDIVVLDAASMHTSGDRICARLRASLGELPIIHIRPEGMKNGHSDADVLLYPPFTYRKLVNRIERFVEDADTANNQLEAGPFALNLEQQTLVTANTENKLTPKLAALMQLFVQNQNQILNRKFIMQTVWKTDYTGDTRTLDVHVRWLRKIIEPEPRKPRYITTVRGVGYRFAIPNGAPEAPSEEAPHIPPADS
ncbi:MAG: response regulator transcription factor [Chloroflexi bacterium]|nr:response regulator transcription factor [Chloroflexota bacterium]